MDHSGQQHPHEPIEPQPASQARLRSARRLLRRKERRSTGLFLAEGPQAVREALAVPGVVTELFVSDSGLESKLLESLQPPPPETEPPPVWRLGDREFGELSGTVTPQGIIAVCRQIDVELAAVAGGAAPKLIVCCSEIRDPGNAGTIIRSADAAGADAVVLGSASVDLYNSKTVRASTGSIFHLPIVVDADLPATLDRFRSRGLQVFAAAGSSDCDLDDLAASGDLARPTVWLMGNEARGLHQDQLRLADRTVSVPIYGRAESLNLSTAAAVCLYASAFAQHRIPPSA